MVDKFGILGVGNEFDGITTVLHYTGTLLPKFINFRVIKSLSSSTLSRPKLIGDAWSCSHHMMSLQMLAIQLDYHS